MSSTSRGRPCSGSRSPTSLRVSMDRVESGSESVGPSTRNRYKSGHRHASNAHGFDRRTGLPCVDLPSLRNRKRTPPPAAARAPPCPKPPAYRETPVAALTARPRRHGQRHVRTARSGVPERAARSGRSRGRTGAPVRPGSRGDGRRRPGKRGSRHRRRDAAPGPAAAHAAAEGSPHPGDRRRRSARCVSLRTDRFSSRAWPQSTVLDCLNTMQRRRGGAELPTSTLEDMTSASPDLFAEYP